LTTPVAVVVRADRIGRGAHHLGARAAERVEAEDEMPPNPSRLAKPKQRPMIGAVLALELNRSQQ